MRNVNMPGMRYLGHVSHEQVNQGQPVPVFEPAAPAGRPSINTREGWNAVAERANTRAFTQAFGRSPVCPAELKAWERSGFSTSFRWDVTA